MPVRSLLDVQADLPSRLATRVVVPLVARTDEDAPIARLDPTATIDGVERVLLFQEMAAIPASALGEPVAFLAPRRPELAAALDLLFTGP